MHIEQARVLQDTGNRIGIVTAIAGYVHGDVVIHGRGDHAGATPMDFRLDPTTHGRVRCSSSSAWHGRPGRGRSGRSVRSRSSPGSSTRSPAAPASRSTSVARTTRHIEGSRATSPPSPRRRRGGAAWSRVPQRQAMPATPLDERIVAALEEAAKATGEPYMTMHSGAAHDTMCVAERVPSAMVFVPCKDGVSHHPRRTPIRPTQRSPRRSSSTRFRPCCRRSGRRRAGSRARAPSGGARGGCSRPASRRPTPLRGGRGSATLAPARPARSQPRRRRSSGRIPWAMRFVRWIRAKLFATTARMPR